METHQWPIFILGWTLIDVLILRIGISYTKSGDPDVDPSPRWAISPRYNLTLFPLQVGDFGLSVINPKMKRLDEFEKARMARGGGPDAAIFRSAGGWDTSGGQPTPILYRPGGSANSNVASARPGEKIARV